MRLEHWYTSLQSVQQLAESFKLKVYHSEATWASSSWSVFRKLKNPKNRLVGLKFFEVKFWFRREFHLQPITLCDLWKSWLGTEAVQPWTERCSRLANLVIIAWELPVLISFLIRIMVNRCRCFHLCNDTWAETLRIRWFTELSIRLYRSDMVKSEMIFEIHVIRKPRICQ